MLESASTPDETPQLEFALTLVLICGVANWAFYASYGFAVLPFRV
jgi:hypothetical protein